MDIQVTSDNIDTLASMHATTSKLKRVPYHDMSKLNYLNDDFDTEEYRLNLVRALHAGGIRNVISGVYSFDGEFGSLVKAWCDIHDIEYTT